MNEELRALYERSWPALAAACARHDGVSQPQLIHVPEAYGEASTRLAIVGQQARFWGGDATFGADPVPSLMRHYADFDLGRAEAGEPFWSACHALHAALSPDGPERAFLWTNLVKVDQRGDRPDPLLEEDVVRLGLLQAELSIVRPDAVVFFTGPRYDPLLEDCFPGLAHERAGLPFVSRLVHERLPDASFRCYDPGFLYHRGSRVVIDRLREVLVESLAA